MLLLTRLPVNLIFRFHLKKKLLQIFKQLEVALLYQYKLLYIIFMSITRMHPSRMRTVSSSCRLPAGGVSGRHLPPREQNDRQV